MTLSDSSCKNAVNNVHFGQMLLPFYLEKARSASAEPYPVPRLDLIRYSNFAAMVDLHGDDSKAIQNSPGGDNLFSHLNVNKSVKRLKI